MAAATIEAARIRSKGGVLSALLAAALSALILLITNGGFSDNPPSCSHARISEAWESWEDGEISFAQRERLVEHYVTLELASDDVFTC